MSVAVFWFRRDLRLHDNAALYHALKSGYPVLPLFIFDTNILEDLTDRSDARVGFIHQSLQEIRDTLLKQGSDMLVLKGNPESVWKEVLERFDVVKVFTNRDFEPYAVDRDKAVSDMLRQRNIPFHTTKDHVIFECDEVLKSDFTPYTVFTPYKRRWLEKLNSRMSSEPDENGVNQPVSWFLKSYPSEKYAANFIQKSRLTPDQASMTDAFPSLGDLGFTQSDIAIPSAVVARSVIRNYDKTRDFPALDATSKLGIHFRFGTISIREKARHALVLNETFLSELVWRDFYSQILANFPHVATRSFRPEYDRIAWRNDPVEIEKWKSGKTGYPIVDAGMRQLNQTGYMHNRVRMITASFLTKHLLADWRIGEAWFAEKLLDFDLASNNGGWQWAAGCGTDAAPYFRIFNPTEQNKKFDSEYKYVRKWVPEFGTPAYPRPVVDHAIARQRCLETYKAGLEKGKV